MGHWDFGLGEHSDSNVNDDAKVEVEKGESSDSRHNMGETVTKVDNIEIFFMI